MLYAGRQPGYKQDLGLHDALLMADCLRCSHPHLIRRGLREAYLWQGERTEAVHERQAKGQGRRDEGNEDGADTEEGADEGQAMMDALPTVLQPCARINSNHTTLSPPTLAWPPA